MSRKQIYASICLCLYASFSLADKGEFWCEYSNEKPKFTYKKALKLKKKDRLIAFCQLSNYGDHRAQFKLASYYIKLDTTAAKNEAYIWSLISNFWYKEKRKETLQKIAINGLSPDQIDALQQKAGERFVKIGTTTEINQINYFKIRHKRRPTGSNIFRTEEYIRNDKSRRLIQLQ